MAAHLMFGCLETSTYLRNKLMLGSKRKYPVHPINSKREKIGKYHLLQNELKDDAERFRSYFRMYPQTFSTILDLVRNDLQKFYQFHLKSA